MELTPSVTRKSRRKVFCHKRFPSVTMREEWKVFVIKVIHICYKDMENGRCFM